MEKSLSIVILITSLSTSFCSLTAPVAPSAATTTAAVTAPPTSGPLTFYNQCPDGCPVSEVNNIITTTNTLDASGNITKSTNTGNTSSTYTYDANRNVLVETYYTNATWTLPSISTYTYTYNATRKLAQSVSTLSGTTTYTYGTNGYLSSTTNTSPGGVLTTTTYTYDASNRLVSDSSGSTYAYDTYNRIKTLTIPGGRYAFTYDRSYAFTYDSSGRIATLTFSSGIAVITMTNYYDANGNLTTQTNAYTGFQTTTSTFTYSQGVINGRPSTFNFAAYRYFNGINFGLM